MTGTGFSNTTTVSLVASDGTAYPLTNLQIDSPTQATVIIPANSIPAATYTIRATQADGTTANHPDAFTMVQGGEANLVTNLVVPNSIPNASPATIYVQYSNTGDFAMPAPLLLLTATNAESQQGAIMTLNPALEFPNATILRASEPAGYSSSVQILATGATPGLLQPGESITVPVYYAGWITPVPNFQYFAPYSFQLGVLQADNTTAVDWAAMGPSLQPPTIPTAAWTTVFVNLTTNMGSTWGSVVQKMDQDAAYLGSLGETVTDVSQLWSFEIQQAIGISPVQSLATATDMTVQAPGLPLSVDRSYASTIVTRDLLGPFGYGWALGDGWGKSLAVNSSGDVIITDSDDSQEVFQPVLSYSSATGAYSAQPGDYNALTNPSSGVYLLTAQDGQVTEFQNGRVAYIQDADGNRITAGYTNGLLTSLTDSSGASIQLAYNAAGRITSVTNSLGQTTTYTYDATSSYLLSVTDYDGYTTT